MDVGSMGPSFGELIRNISKNLDKLKYSGPNLNKNVRHRNLNFKCDYFWAEYIGVLL